MNTWASISEGKEARPFGSLRPGCNSLLGTEDPSYPRVYTESRRHRPSLVHYEVICGEYEDPRGGDNRLLVRRIWG